MKKKLPRFTKSKGRFYWTPTTNGKTRWFRLPDKYDDAIDKYHEHEAGATPDTVNHAFDIYLESERFSRLAKDTKKNYRSYIKIMRPVLGHLPLSDIKATLLSRFIHRVGYIGNNMMSPLSGAFKMAILEGLIDTNPIRAADIQKAEIPKRIKEVDLSQVMAIYDACGDSVPWSDEAPTKSGRDKNYDVRLYIDIALATGLRYSDITSLTLEDSITDEGLRVPVRNRRSEGQVLLFAWTPELRTICSRLPFKFQENGHKEGLIRTHFLKVRKSLGITDLKPHDLRRFAIQEARRRGADAQNLAGYAQASQTAQYLAGTPKVVTPLFYNDGDDTQDQIAGRIEQLEAELEAYRALQGGLT